MIIELSGQNEIQNSKRSGKTGDQGKTVQGLQLVLRTLQECTNSLPLEGHAEGSETKQPTKGQ